MIVSQRWRQYFLRLCLEHARMSKDPNTQVGALIVDGDMNILTSGFNGFPRGIFDTRDRLNDRDRKLGLVLHAEINCLMQAARTGVKVKSATLFLVATDATGQVWGGPPCSRCALHLIQAGVRWIIAPPQKQNSKWKDDIDYSRHLLIEAGVKFYEQPLLVDDEK